MKPVFQTKFSNPSLTSTGDADCLMATIASILHRPLESIPDFGMSGIGWFEELYEWCQNEDIGLLYFTEETMRMQGLCLGAYCMLVWSVKGFPEGPLHAVVGKTFLEEKQDLPEGDTKWVWHVAVEHDPNSHGVDLDELKYYVFLIPTPQEPVSWERFRESMTNPDIPTPSERAEIDSIKERHKLK